MRSLRFAAVLIAFSAAAPVCAQEGAAVKSEAPSTRKASNAKTSAKKEKCEPHGVQRSLCTRCNPKLEAVYKSKGDWCPEHARAESQCAICNPDLKKKGVKP